MVGSCACWVVMTMVPELVCMVSSMVWPASDIADWGCTIMFGLTASCIETGARCRLCN